MTLSPSQAVELARKELVEVAHLAAEHYRNLLIERKLVKTLKADLARVTKERDDLDWNQYYNTAGYPVTDENEARSEAIETAAIARHAASTKGEG